MNYRQYSNSQPLSNDQMMRVAPSIFATQPYERMSERYSFIPTIQVVDAMRSNGFMPYSAFQSNTRIEGKAPFTKHMIRFRDVSQNAPAMSSLAVGQIFPELVLVNSHDGASSYQLDAGLFRLVCLNGLMVDDAKFNQIRVKHSGDVLPVIEASFEVVKNFPEIIGRIEDFQRLQLTDGQQRAYAEAAATLRYDTDDNGTLLAPMPTERLLTARRSADTANTVWNTYNRVQENLTQGGLRGRSTTGRRLRTRAVNSISEDTRINKALWTLTAKMAELVKAA